MTAKADGFLLVDKPAGATSFDIVNHVRGALLRAVPDLQPPRTGRRPGGPRPPRFKCGHTGTLDPAATGLLVVVTGKGSRLVPFLTGLDKTYLATVRFGSETDTLDAEGQVTATAPAPADAAAVDGVLDRFRGPIMQVPPLVSALKKDGKPLHARVRAGEDLAEPEPRPVRIDRLEITGRRWPDPVSGAFELDLEVACGSGTYVRSLARDLGRAVGSAAHLSVLRRLRVGPFDVADSLPRVMTTGGEELLAALRPLRDALPAVPVLPVTAEEAAQIALGGQPRPDWMARVAASVRPPVGSLLRLVAADGGLVAMAIVESEGPRIAAVLVTANDDRGDTPCA